MSCAQRDLLEFVTQEIDRPDTMTRIPQEDPMEAGNFSEGCRRALRASFGARERRNFRVSSGLEGTFRPSWPRFTIPPRTSLGAYTDAASREQGSLARSPS